MKFDFSKDGVKSIMYSSSNYGDAFDDIDKWRGKKLRLPKCVIVRSGAIIDNVSFVYEEMTLSHGNDGGSLRTFNLEEGEYIVKADGDFKSFNNAYMLNKLEFTTNKGNIYKCSDGQGGSNSFSFKADEGSAIYCLHGRAKSYMGSIGFYAAKIDCLLNTSMFEMPDTKSSDPFAGIANMFGQK